jgi:hypothetical protein
MMTSTLPEMTWAFFTGLLGAALAALAALEAL